MWLFLFALWIVLNGRITVELVIFGVVIASAVTFFANRVIGYTASIDRRILRNLPVFLLYILNLIREIIISSFKMCGMVYSAEAPDPVIIEFHSGFDTQLQNVLLANSITDLEESARAVREYPGRFAAAMTVSQGPGAPGELRAWRERGLTAVKFEMSEGLGYTNPGWYPDFRLDSPVIVEPQTFLLGSRVFERLAGRPTHTPPNRNLHACVRLCREALKATLARTERIQPAEPARLIPKD